MDEAPRLPEVEWIIKLIIYKLKLCMEAGFSQIQSYNNHLQYKGASSTWVFIVSMYFLKGTGINARKWNLFLIVFGLYIVFQLGMIFHYSNYTINLFYSFKERIHTLGLHWKGSLVN